MIGLDTNILAHYYIEDSGDGEAQRQRQAARQLLEGNEPLAVCKTVLLELEWVMRGYYGFERGEILQVFDHLLGLPHVEVEQRNQVEQALALYREGFDFADALHHAAYSHCARMASFDDRKFARKAKRLGLTPTVLVLRDRG
ncbi:hypothetical protein JCM13664_15880 [Methylothermus subterraneus]